MSNTETASDEVKSEDGVEVEEVNDGDIPGTGEDLDFEEGSEDDEDDDLYDSGEDDDDDEDDEDVQP